MTHYLVDPIADPRWAQFIDQDPRASVFHSPGWLLALRETYGYQPTVSTTSDPSQPLTNGVVFCHVNSWLTGSRFVSLPFADHCEPLVEDHQDSADFVKPVASGRWKYVELRPISATPGNGTNSPGFTVSERFWLHRLDLSDSLGDIFHALHEDCVRRKIRRAKKEKIVCEEGNNAALLGSFYQLLQRTRRRHRLPPQPREWFRNLSKFLGDSIKIRVASKDGRPIASILTFAYNNKLMYKYGCSDERHHKSGGMQLLFWQAIEEAKEKNYSEFDLGRCEWENTGLRVFKDRWGATHSALKYWRYQPGATATNRQIKFARVLFRYCPHIFLQAAGRFYRHIG